MRISDWSSDVCSSDLLARTPAAEVASAQKDARPTIAGLIKNEVRIFRAVRHEPQGLERPGTQIVSFGPHQPLNADDHVGVDILAHEGSRDSLQQSELSRIRF